MTVLFCIFKMCVSYKSDDYSRNKTHNVISSYVDARSQQDNLQNIS